MYRLVQKGQRDTDFIKIQTANVIILIIISNLINTGLDVSLMTAYPFDFFLLYISSLKANNAI